jgi:hypothetical protein
MHPVIICDPPFIRPGDPTQPRFIPAGDLVQLWLDQTLGARSAERPEVFSKGSRPAALAKRSRQPSLTTILRQARKAGADRVVIGGAVVYLNPMPGEGPSAAPTEAADNSWDDLLPPGGRNATH